MRNENLLDRSSEAYQAHAEAEGLDDLTADERRFYEKQSPQTFATNPNEQIGISAPIIPEK